jgi:hypothetical protein
LIDEKILLQEKFSELISWERIKRREKILLSALLYSLVVSLVVLPARDLVPPWLRPFFFPPLPFTILAMGVFLLHPWRDRESLRSVFLLDKTLHLQERAITAWEIVGRREKSGAERLVLEEVGEKLRGVDPRELFKRPNSWHTFLTPPLLLLWLLAFWLDVGLHLGSGSPTASLAQKLKEFSQDLQEKAQAQGLTESRKVARSLEEAAEKRLGGKVGEKELKEDLMGMAGRIERMGQKVQEEFDLRFPAATREALLDLKAELQASRPSLFPESARREGNLAQEILGRLSPFPRLKEEVEKGLRSRERLNEKELQRFLDQLDKDIVAELDRRTLQEIAEFLAVLLRGAEGRDVEGAQGKELGEPFQEATKTDRGGLQDAEKGRGTGSLPGDQPGTKRQALQTPPFKARAATHLKGLLGEGKSSRLGFRGEGPAKGREVSPEEVLTSYRRQAEEELASERIPEGLRDAIKSYFLSLGMTEDQNKPSAISRQPSVEKKN